MRKAALTIVLVWLIPVSADVGVQTSPTEDEQFLLELLNRARADPEGEVERLSSQTWGDRFGGEFTQPQTPDLNEGLAPGTISTDSKQPLAFSMSLIRAAENHTEWMIQADDWGHFEPENGTIGVNNYTGQTPGDRTSFAGYDRFVGENIAVAVSTAPWRTERSMQAEAQARHDNLFVDNDIPRRGHRTNMLNPSWMEVGIGFSFATSYQGPFSRSWEYANLATFNFGRGNSVGPQLTGVLFEDVDGDEFYTPNGQEFMGDVTLQLSDVSGNEVATTQTFSESGGFNIPIGDLDPGEYVLSAIAGLPSEFNSVNCGEASCTITIPAGGASENIGRTLAPEFVDVGACEGSWTSGDFDGDNAVDFGDFLILSRNFGEEVDSPSGGDTDCSGTVDFADFLVLSRNFGTSLEVESHLAATSYSVPEPRVPLWLLCVTGALLRNWCRYDAGKREVH